MEFIALPPAPGKVLVNTALTDARFLPNWELKALRVVVVVVASMAVPRFRWRVFAAILHF